MRILIASFHYFYYDSFNDTILHEVKKMNLEDMGIGNAVLDIKPLDHLMGKHAFIRAGQWDYERVTYDYRIDSQEKGVTYYVRIFGEAIEGDVDSRNAVIQLKALVIGKHYYLHGIAYVKEKNYHNHSIEHVRILVKDLLTDISYVSTHMITLYSIYNN